MSESRQPIPKELSERPALAILRAQTTRYLDAVVDELVLSGLRSLELTLTTPGALKALSVLRNRLPAEVSIGMGSVLSVDHARAALDAGAANIVTPGGGPEVIDYCLTARVPVMPGAFTATEIVTAWELGASAVKLFPANLGGPNYLRDLGGPLPHIPLIPTGGVTVENATLWLAAGALAVGLGGPLLGDSLEGGDLVALGERARILVQSLPSPSLS